MSSIISKESESKIAAIEREINQCHTRITATEDEIVRLVKLNEGRKSHLRTLGNKLSELKTFELGL